MNIAMKRRLGICMMGLGVIGLATSVGAHHSVAMYDYTKSMTLTGTVREMQWTNPHMFIKADAMDTAGNLMEWSIECGTPNINSRHGWRRSDINPGDKVVMEVFPMRDGRPAGTLLTIKLPDGRTLYGPAGDVLAAPPGSNGDPLRVPGPAPTP